MIKLNTLLSVMSFKELVSRRRSYRKILPIEVTPELISEFVEIAKLAPSCDNNQPWRFVFVYDKKTLEEIREVFDEKNYWIKTASLLIGVFSNPQLDCQIEERNYYLFDTGIATAFMLLHATEMGLVAHPTSYYNEEKAKEIMNIPPEMELMSIIAIGKRDDVSKIQLTPEQEQNELERPKRFSIQYLSYLNKYMDEYEENKQRFAELLKNS